MWPGPRSSPGAGRRGRGWPRAGRCRARGRRPGPRRRSAHAAVPCTGRRCNTRSARRAHARCRSGVLPRQPLEQAEASGRLQQSREAGMPGSFGDRGPARKRRGARCRQVHDRTVQAFERGLERRRDAGTAQRRIDRRDIDLYRARLARRPAHERGQGLVLARRTSPSRIVPGGASSGARSKRRRRRLRSTARCVAAEQALQPRRRPARSCRREPAVGIGLARLGAAVPGPARDEHRVDAFAPLQLADGDAGQLGIAAPIRARW